MKLKLKLVYFAFQKMNNGSNWAPIIAVDIPHGFVMAFLISVI